MKETDASGLTCPAPVVQTKAALKEQGADGPRVVPDNAAAQQNEERVLESQGFQTNLEQTGSDHVAVGSCGDVPVPAERPQCAPQSAPQPAPSAHRADRKVLILCATDRIGFGDDGLGMKLMVNFIRTLKEMGEELWRLVLVNNGVKLTIDGSQVLEDLKAQEERGLKILVCGTCLGHFDLLERKRVGETTNMLDIVTAMQLADKVISL